MLFLEKHFAHCCNDSLRAVDVIDFCAILPTNRVQLEPLDAETIAALQGEVRYSIASNSVGEDGRVNGRFLQS